MSKIGIIDIGTNTVLCLKATADRNNISIISDNRYHYRAGRRLDDNGNISSEYKGGLKRALLKAIESVADCQEVKILATEVLRKPKDGPAFAAEMSEETGYAIAIIDPQREAELSFAGATSGLENHDERVAVIDIGGGSSELAIGKRDRLERWSSIKLGAVSVCENVGNDSDLDNYLAAAQQIFDRSDFADLLNVKPARVIVVGGSAVACAAILADLREFKPENIQGYVIYQDILALLLENLSTMSIAKRKEMMPFDSQRADIIVGGGAIILTFMRKYGFESVEISTNGFRQGYLLEHFSQLNA